MIKLIEELEQKLKDHVAEHQKNVVEFGGIIKAFLYMLQELAKLKESGKSQEQASDSNIEKIEHS